MSDGEGRPTVVCNDCRRSLLLEDAAAVTKPFSGPQGVGETTFYRCSGCVRQEHSERLLEVIAQDTAILVRDAGKVEGGQCCTEDGRPDFLGFAEALRAEARGTAVIHRNTADPPHGDIRSLLDLADCVVGVGDRLGFCSRHHTQKEGNDG